MEFGSTILNDIAGFYNAPDQAAFDKKRADLQAKFARLEKSLSEGPYFAGERFSLVDTVYGPIFRYFDVFDAIDDFGIFGDTSRVRAYRATLAARPSVMDAVLPDYPSRLERFLHERKSYLSTRMASG